MNVFAQGAGMVVDDEIAQSGDPGRHANDIVANLVREGFRYACLHAVPSNAAAALLLREACRNSGKIAFTTWNQNLPPNEAMLLAERWKSEGHAANVETSVEEAKWNDAELNTLVRIFAGNAAVVATEGAWGRDNKKAQRWWGKGIFGIFEAIESENKQATINAMAELANTLRFPVDQRGFWIYLTRGYPAREYTDVIGEARGRWGIFRYGDVDATDWAEFRGWPKTSIPSPLTGMSITDAHKIVIQCLNEVNARQAALGKGPLGENAALVNAAVSSQAALDNEWTAAIGAQFAALRKKLLV